MKHITYRILGLCTLILMATACTTVQPWERGSLAQDMMAWQADAMKGSLDNHIHFAKEGTSGGGSAAGGGCGCN
ncbi:MAG: hypothetical protein CSH37_10185 [Thalassolituus sp.]|nr:DUF4266 domain-containing protein [Pseudomonadota bacterium]TNC84738.1 MAG: hypothetical protein CSH37_10185 [Thalassolituus sp.]